MSSDTNWMDEVEQSAEKQEKIGHIPNTEAPQMIKVKRAPPRMQKAFYLQEKYAEAFDDFAYKQKKSKGKKAPELAELAIKLLLEHYGQSTKDL